MISSINSSASLVLQNMQAKTMSEIKPSNKSIEAYASSQYKQQQIPEEEQTFLHKAHKKSDVSSVNLSKEGLAKQQNEALFSDEEKTKTNPDEKKTSANSIDPTKDKSVDGEELTEAQQKQVEELKQRDAEVRAHEQAHKSAAGSLSIGGMSFEYQTGPDNKRYAVGGEVSIDVSKVADDPEATIAKAQQIRRAANAPAEPSSQDRKVAAQASQMEAEARKEISENQVNKNDKTEKSSSPNDLSSSTNNRSDADSLSPFSQSLDATTQVAQAQEHQSSNSPRRNVSNYYQNIQSNHSSSNISGFDFYT